MGTKRFVLLLCAVLIGVSFIVHAEARPVFTWNKVRETYLNKDCRHNDTCDLKKLTFIKEDFTISDSAGPLFGTRMLALYETTAPSSLTKYVFVQFLRGCKFDSKIEEGVVQKNPEAVSKWQFEGTKFFRFPVWSIDSNDRDPVFLSTPGKPRHFAYRWGLTTDFRDRDIENYHGIEPSPYPRLYVIEAAISAFRSGPEVRNTSLEFKTCLYKTTDVPHEATENQVNFATPIHCFFWQSSFIYDHDTRGFETKTELDPVCLN